VLLNGNPYHGPFKSLFEGHGIAEILSGISNPATIKTDELWMLGEFFNLLHLLIACQHADMTGMLSVTNLFYHIFSSKMHF
jgi:hypothetical protein